MSSTLCVSILVVDNVMTNSEVPIQQIKGQTVRLSRIKNITLKFLALQFSDALDRSLLLLTLSHWPLVDRTIVVLQKNHDGDIGQ